MKGNYLSILLVGSLLAGLLSGCGAAAATAPTTVPTQAPQTQPLETETSTTAPTKPKTFWEEKGIVPWEGMQTSFDPSWNPPMQGYTDQFAVGQLVFVEITPERPEVRRSQPMYSDASVEVTPCKIADFSTTGYQWILDGFYEASNHSEMNQEEWLSSLEGYRAVHFTYSMTVKAFEEGTFDDVSDKAEIGSVSFSGINTTSPSLLNVQDEYIYTAKDNAFCEIPCAENAFNIYYHSSTYSMDGDSTDSDPYAGIWIGGECFVLAPAEVEVALILPEFVSSMDNETFDSFIFGNRKSDAQDGEAAESSLPWKEQSLDTYIASMDKYQLHYFTTECKP